MSKLAPYFCTQSVYKYQSMHVVYGYFYARRHIMTICGKYSVDSNFVTVYTNEGRLYTIARNTGDYGYVEIGTYMMGHKLTWELFDRLQSTCRRVGTFDLHA